MDTTRHQVTVNFDSTTNPNRERVSFSSDGRIEITTERGEVTYTLQQAGSRARFPSNPIQWVANNLMPIAPPPEVTVHRLDDYNVTVEITAAPGTQEFRFYVIVQTVAGRFFGSDPTIVTMRPGDSSGR